jgi:hypothetical protein
MVITTSVVVFIPGWVIIIGANTPGSDFLLAYSIFERVQIIIFTIQELIISALYLVSCYRYWTAENLRTSVKIRRMIVHLTIVNIVVMALDGSVIYVEWSGDYLLHTAYKGFAYSVKLKIELGILTKLVELVKEARSIEYQERTTRQLRDEWTSTLDRTIGPGHQRESTEDRSEDDPLRSPKVPSEKVKVQLPHLAFSPSTGDIADEPHRPRNSRSITG